MQRLKLCTTTHPCRMRAHAIDIAEYSIPASEKCVIPCELFKPSKTIPDDSRLISTFFMNGPDSHDARFHSHCENAWLCQL